MHTCCNWGLPENLVWRLGVRGRSEGVCAELIGDAGWFK